LKDGRDEYAAFLETLPTYVDLGSHVVVHAGLRPGVALEDQTIEDLTELRTLGEDRESRAGTRWYEVYDGEKFALFGHWPAKWPRAGRAPSASTRAASTATASRPTSSRPARSTASLRFAHTIRDK
jgi:hypothetical protein